MRRDERRLRFRSEKTKERRQRGECVLRRMESGHKVAGVKRTIKSSGNDSEEEVEPPSPIHIAPEGALAPDFELPDEKELRRIESATQNRLKAILEVAGVTGLSQLDPRSFQDPEILRKLTNRFVYVCILMLSHDSHMAGLSMETRFPRVPRA